MAYSSRSSSPLKDDSSFEPNLDAMEPLLTVQEVARQLRVDATTVRRWISQGILEAVYLPHHGKRQTYRIKQETVRKLMEQPLASPEL
jgi:excisionase family DNA binding protein